MDLNHLKSFVKVAQTGHLTRAAEELHTSQPTISAHIKALEATCGCQLFERTVRGMQLTQAGLQLLDQAKAVLAAVGGFLDTAHTLGGGLRQKFAIGLNTDPTILKIDPLVQASRESCPPIEFHFFQSSSTASCEAIAKGQLDAGFVFSAPPQRELLSIPLAHFNLVIIGPWEWAERMAGKPFQEVARLPWVLPSEDCIFRVILEQALRRHGITPEVKLVSDQERSIKAFVKQGYGISILPEFEVAALAQPDEFCVWDQKLLSIPLAFAFLRERAEEPLLRTILDLLGQVWGVPLDADALRSCWQSPTPLPPMTSASLSPQPKRNPTLR